MSLRFSISSIPSSSLYTDCLYYPKLRRPDDFSVVMALGDSITAGLFATPSELKNQVSVIHPDQKPFPSIRGRPQRYLGANLIPGFEEYRGISYATGDDEGAQTLPNVNLTFESSQLPDSSTIFLRL